MTFMMMVQSCCGAQLLLLSKQKPKKTEASICSPLFLPLKAFLSEETDHFSGLIEEICRFELSRDIFNAVFMAISAVKAHKTLELTESLQYTKHILAFVNF